MYKTEYIGDEWCVICGPIDKVVAKIPHHYREDEAVANAIATLLNENNKIVINLSI